MKTGIWKTYYNNGNLKCIYERNKMLKDFKKEKEMPKEIIEKYKGQVPDEIIEIWENYGLGSFLNGYLRVINPDDYKELVEETYFRGKESIPLFTTAFADVITWQENGFIDIVQYRYEDFEIMLKNMGYFLKFILRLNIHLLNMILF